ncbi:MAG: flagellar biosynthetic protein FliO [Opitutaceae bacterium]
MKLIPAMLMVAALAAPTFAQSADAGDEVFFPRTSPAPKEGGVAESSAALAGAPTVVMFAGYAVVLVVLGAGVFFFLKRGGWRQVVKRSEGRLQVRESRMLGNRQFLMVVEYEDSRLLVGVSPGRIELLTPLSSPHSHLEALPDGLMAGAKGG